MSKEERLKVGAELHAFWVRNFFPDAVGLDRTVQIVQRSSSNPTVFDITHRLQLCRSQGQEGLHIGAILFSIGGAFGCNKRVEPDNRNCSTFERKRPMIANCLPKRNSTYGRQYVDSKWWNTNLQDPFIFDKIIPADLEGFKWCTKYGQSLVNPCRILQSRANEHI